MDMDKGMRAIMREFREADRVRIDVGVQGNTAGGVAEYAAANEYGTKHIPQRPAIGTAFDENRAKYVQGMERAARRMGTEAFARMANQLGLRAKQDIQSTITGRNFLPSLSPATVKAKKGSSKTLVDTGAYVNSIVHVIKK
jgi:hypothetical protein